MTSVAGGGQDRTRTRRWWFIASGLVVALLLAGVVSSFASADPDGLDSATLEGCTVDQDGAITGGTCIAQRGREHELAGGPLADYGIRDIDGSLSTGLAGALGVLLTFAAGGALFWLVRRRRPSRDEQSAATGSG